MRADTIPVTVSLRDGFLHHPGTVVDRCRQAGMQVEQVHAAVGVVSGRVHKDSFEELLGLPGVDSVRIDQ